MARKKDNTPEPMDPSVNEKATGTMHVANKRNAYSLVELVAEVRALFPETEYEFRAYNGRNVALGVQFLDVEEPLLKALWLLRGGDSRVQDVWIGTYGEKSVIIQLHNSARSMDDRTSWGIEEAYAILAEPLVLGIPEDGDPRDFQISGESW